MVIHNLSTDDVPVVHTPGLAPSAPISALSLETTTLDVREQIATGQHSVAMVSATESVENAETARAITSRVPPQLQAYAFKPGQRVPGCGRPLGAKNWINRLPSAIATVERQRRKRLAAHYVEQAFDDPQTLRHLVDKFIPNAGMEHQPPAAPQVMIFIGEGSAPRNVI